MRRFGMRPLPLAIGAVALLQAPAIAQVASTQNTVVDFTPLLNSIIQLVALIITGAVIPFAWYWFRRLMARYNIDTQEFEAKNRALVDEVLAKGIGAAAAKASDMAKGLPLTVNVKNQMIADAVNYTMKTIPDTVKAMGLEAKLSAMVESRLGLMALQQQGIVPPGLPQAPTVQPAASTVPPTPAPAVPAETK